MVLATSVWLLAQHPTASTLLEQVLDISCGSSHDDGIVSFKLPATCIHAVDYPFRFDDIDFDSRFTGQDFVRF
jgi:hypothetical protein